MPTISLSTSVIMDIDFDDDETDRRFAVFKVADTTEANRVLQVEESGDVTIKGAMDGPNWIFKMTAGGTDPGFVFQDNGTVKATFFPDGRGVFIEGGLRTLYTFTDPKTTSPVATPVEGTTVALRSGGTTHVSVYVNGAWRNS
jgi:hypothetical protein